MEQNETYLALYRTDEHGRSVLLAVSADPVLVAEFAEALLAETVEDHDPITGALHGGRRRALELVRDGSE